MMKASGPSLCEGADGVWVGYPAAVLNVKTPIKQRFLLRLDRVIW